MRLEHGTYVIHEHKSPVNDVRVRVWYGDYKKNTDIMQKVQGTYDPEEKTIEVIMDEEDMHALGLAIDVTELNEIIRSD